MGGATYKENFMSRNVSNHHRHLAHAVAYFVKDCYHCKRRAIPKQLVALIETFIEVPEQHKETPCSSTCLLYTSDAADDM
eukprot:5618257-Prorocentrum_lima.AAC.1